MAQFDARKLYSCRKHCEKRRNCLLQAISPFLTMFSTVCNTYFSFHMHFKMSSAICFNLDWSKFLSSGNVIKLIVPFATMHLFCGECKVRSARKRDGKRYLNFVFMLYLNPFSYTDFCGICRRQCHYEFNKVF